MYEKETIVSHSSSEVLESCNELLRLPSCKKKRFKDVKKKRKKFDISVNLALTKYSLGKYTF